MRAIAETGYTGYVGQERSRKQPDALKSPQQAVTLCTAEPVQHLDAPLASKRRLK